MARLSYEKAKEVLETSFVFENDEDLRECAEIFQKFANAGYIFSRLGFDLAASACYRHVFSETWKRGAKPRKEN